MTNEYRPSRYVSRVAIDRATVLSLEPTIDISHMWDEELNLENRITGENFFWDMFCPPYEGVNVASVDKIRDVFVQVHWKKEGVYHRVRTEATKSQDWGWAGLTYASPYHVESI